MVTNPRANAGAPCPTVLAAVLTATLAAVLTGCAPAMPRGAAGTSTTASSLFAHVHGLAQDGPAVLLATHDGLFRQVGGGQPVRVSDQPFDVMGFTLAGDRMLASGHPAPGTDSPPDLGLSQSTDGGRTWASVSLLGGVDFHRLRAVGPRVWGITADDGRLLVSADSGHTWATLGTPGLFDVAVDPSDPTRLVGTTETGPVVSTDGGRTFTALAGAPVLLLLAWTGTGLYGITPTGTIVHSSDGHSGWTVNGVVAGEPQALWADGAQVGIASTLAVSLSTDGGRTFTERIPFTAHH